MIAGYWRRRLRARASTTREALEPLDPRTALLDLTGAHPDLELAAGLAAAADIAAADIIVAPNMTALVSFRLGVVVLDLHRTQPDVARRALGIAQAMTDPSGGPVTPATPRRLVTVWVVAEGDRLDTALAASSGGNIAPELLLSAWSRHLDAARGDQARAALTRSSCVRSLVGSYGRMGAVPARSVLDGLDRLDPHTVHALVVRDRRQRLTLDSALAAVRLREAMPR